MWFDQWVHFCSWAVFSHQCKHSDQSTNEAHQYPSKEVVFSLCEREGMGEKKKTEKVTTFLSHCTQKKKTKQSTGHETWCAFVSVDFNTRFLSFFIYSFINQYFFEITDIKHRLSNQQYRAKVAHPDVLNKWPLKSIEHFCFLCISFISFISIYCVYYFGSTVFI